ncbi:type VI secretion system Vgr family protein [Ralstonia wenshanensis]|uniref:type VI secretion system Vgr family protein n=1 Tax=Ralstonia wenshanensis TaxID=2842456 RepID=UPI001E61776A|nr:type VI secretion system Vgr family protein [Ralstonia wenshanensis]
MRASSPWQGERFGAIQIPRIGQEVIVDFLNGDPDCPIITGRVPNRENMPQWPMPGHHALSGFVSKELHGGRTNTFVQDDTQGQIQTQLQSDHQNSSLSLGFSGAGQREHGPARLTRLAGVKRTVLRTRRPAHRAHRLMSTRLQTPHSRPT